MIADTTEEVVGSIFKELLTEKLLKRVKARKGLMPFDYHWLVAKVA